ncbi:Putative serine esterase (DUF676) [Musa troglodytarum]|uniref:Serine esterase (DUF676) n=1 Tax=Musa troglodytarum TaxID=320322 RepID=A0A9E7JAR9_9LILI|nr:Putative serine esterase (DUF676) [Musa troglodytarum]
MFSFVSAVLQIGNTLPNSSQCNYSTLTFDGVDVMGERLADEVISIVANNPGLQKISFVGHSLGGLIARYAITLLYEKSIQKHSSEENGECEDNTPGTTSALQSFKRRVAYSNLKQQLKNITAIKKEIKQLVKTYLINSHGNQLYHLKFEMLISALEMDESGKAPFFLQSANKPFQSFSEQWNPARATEGERTKSSCIPRATYIVSIFWRNPEDK